MSSYFEPHKPKMPAKLKSPDRIEIWRQEVSLSCSAVEAAETTSFPAPVIRQPSFWKKILRRDSTKSGKEEGKEGVVKTGMYEAHEGLKDLGDEAPDGDEICWAGSSMGISAESELAGFRPRRDRLERAQRLLNHGSGKRNKK